MFLLICSLLSSILTAQNYEVTPYGAKVASLAEGGRAFINGYDSIMINPAGTAMIEDPQFGFAFDAANYVSMSIGYVDDSGFHIMQVFKDIDRAFSVAGAQTYAGFSYALSKYWLVGANFGYNYYQDNNGWDVNFGLDFGPGLKNATRTGFIGAVTVRNPFENGGQGEVSGTLGYSYKSTFSITIDNIYVFQDDIIIGTTVVDRKRYDIVMALESYPLESDDYCMSFAGRIEDVSGDNNLKFGIGFGYVGDTFRADLGLFATKFEKSKIEKMTFAISLIFGV